MKNYNKNDLVKNLKPDSSPIILYGAGTLGKIAWAGLRALKLRADYFCDADEQKQGKLYCGLKTISPEELNKLSRESHIFLCNNYLGYLEPKLKRMNFKNIYNCVELLEKNEFSQADLVLTPLNIKRQIALHRSSCSKADAGCSRLEIKYIDIIATERCSLRCRDCSNLMQYYIKPSNCDTSLLLASVDKLMEKIDRLDEFRVIGGEPFMNAELYKIINKLITYDKAGQVVIYTNGTILPSGDNFFCLKNGKVILDITNYGKLSRNYQKLVAALKENKINFVTHNVKGTLWNDCASIKFQARSEQEISDMFMNCCVNDVLSLLHGKIYRCPFAAHAANLAAIPFNDKDIIDLTVKNDNNLKSKLVSFYKEKKYILACYYCQGRAYNGKQIEPAIQAKKPLALV